MVTPCPPKVRLTVGGFAVVLVACGPRVAQDPIPAEPRQVVAFVYDRSTSIQDHTLELAQRLTEARLLEMDHGDRIVGMQLLQLSLAEAPRRWSQSIPEREVQGFEIMRDSLLRVRFLMDANLLLRQLASPESRSDVNGTDILSTMHDIAEEIRAYPEHVATMYLFSDMLQSNRQIDMEGLRKMPPTGWVQQAAESGTLPDLTDLCVVVVGARVDNQAAQRVKSFWTEYFETTGARLEDRNYVLRPVRLPSAPCSSTGMS